jgi:hypothetical protein
MARVIRAAAIYGGAILLLGFALGILRVLWLAPRIGALPAVAIELPPMLGASALLAARLVRRGRFGMAEAGAMGLLAFALLRGAEAALAAAFGQGWADWLRQMATPAGALGLAGQAAFGALPAIMAWRQARRAAKG